MCHMHVIVNRPGYMPDSSERVICLGITTAADAVRVWNEEIGHTLDTVVDDGVFLDVDTRRSVNVALAEVCLTTGTDFTVDVAGYEHTVAIVKPGDCDRPVAFIEDREGGSAVCTQCADGYSVKGMHPVTHREADDFGDQCSVCHKMLWLVHS